MKSKVAILTLNGYFNYGNRLQNYATQEIIKDFNFEVETIINNNKEIYLNKRSNENISKINKIRGATLNELTSKLGKKWYRYIHKESILVRTKVFKKFTEDYIKETSFAISDINIPEDLSNRYDYFITGSDQVWNPVNTLDSSIYFLTFAETHKRIAFSPSFGVSKIESKLADNYSNWISSMKSLSVREEDGAKIIKELTGRDAQVLVDPTLLLAKEKWLKIAKEPPNKPKGKYLLTYFIGGIPKEYKKQITHIARKNNLKIINLGDIKDKESYQTGPSEFIDYINSSSIFCTDSFHGVVFSIIMETPFIIYKRVNNSQSMYSRLETLLGLFQMKSREAKNIKDMDDIFNVDFSHVPYIMSVEKKRALDYLRKALNVKDG